MNKIAISFIVPVYNVEKYLDRCIESLRNQTLKNIEIILVDDDSPDKCPEKCDYYSKIDSRIKVIHKKNEGLGLARNSGMDIASGEYVFFVDSDDYLEINTGEVLYNIAKLNDLKICIGGYYEEDLKGNKKLIESKFSGKLLNNKEIIEQVLKEMLGEAVDPPYYNLINMAVWQGIYSLDWIKKEGLRFESERIYISEDIMFHLSALPLVDKMMVVSGGYYHHIVDNSNSLTNSYNPERFKKICDLYIEQKKRILNLGLDESYIERIQSTYLSYVRLCLKQIVKNSSKLGFKATIIEINKINNNNILQEILGKYPYKRTRKVQRLYSGLLKNRCSISIFIITKFFVFVKKR